VADLLYIPHLFLSPSFPGHVLTVFSLYIQLNKRVNFLLVSHEFLSPGAPTAKDIANP
jgi:hypothetical protein